MKKLMIISVSALALCFALSSCSSPDGGNVQVQTPAPRQSDPINNSRPIETATASEFTSKDEATTWKNENKGKTFEIAVIKNDNSGVKLGHKMNVPSYVKRKHWKVEFMQAGKPVEIVRDGKTVLKAFSQRNDSLFELNRSAGPLTVKVTTVWILPYQGGETEEWEDKIEMTLDN